VFVLSVALTAALLPETLPSAIAGLSRSRAGMTRLDQLTRIGLMQGPGRGLAGRRCAPGWQRRRHRWRWGTSRR